MSLLLVSQLSKTYPGQTRPAVNGVSFAVEPGELVALAGESGSGKSTLLRLLAGLETPEAGTIALHGTLVSTPAAVEAPERRGIGLVFQHHALFPHLTVAQNIAFGLNKRPRAERRQLIGAMLELVNLPGYEPRYPHELSGGERQRIALARSLAPAPRLLLLDEPFSSLDARLRQEVRDETRAILKKHGTTSVFVTHDIHDALSIADRIVLLRQGLVQQEGTPPAIYHAPANDYVASFFGPCNFLPPGVWQRTDEAPAGGRPGRVVGPPATATPDRHRDTGWWVRPEDLVLGAAANDDGALHGTVEHIAFCGDRWDVRLRCRHHGETFDVLVWQPAGNGVPAHVGECRAIRPRPLA